VDRLFSIEDENVKKANEQLRNKAKKDLEKARKFGKTEMFKQELLEFQRRVSD